MKAVEGAVIITVWVALVMLIAFLVQFSWNQTMPHIFGLPEISYWQTWGFAIVSTVFLKSSLNISRSTR